ncbi:MAG: hypothetical protein R3C24_06520 [Cyanobacteriota/Melainabacteria group bacterium]
MLTTASAATSPSLEGGGKEAAISLARQKNIAWTAQTDSTSAIRGFLFSFGPIILIGAIFLFI